MFTSLKNFFSKARKAIWGFISSMGMAAVAPYLAATLTGGILGFWGSLVISGLVVGGFVYFSSNKEG